MKHTFAFNTRRATGKLPRNYAKGYVYDKRYNKLSLPDTVPNTRYVITFDGMLGDGNISTTARDLLLWDQGFYDSKIISTKALTEMNTPFVLNSGEKGTIPGVEQHYGYGVFISQEEKYGKIISHGGSWPGYSTFLFRAVDQKKTFIILSNLSLPYSTEQNIINKLKPEIFKE